MLPGRWVPLLMSPAEKHCPGGDGCCPCGWLRALTLLTLLPQALNKATPGRGAAQRGRERTVPIPLIHNLCLHDLG